MGSSIVQFPVDPAAPPEAPRSGDTAPGKKRDDPADARDNAAAAALTASFADILRSKRQDIIIGKEGREMKESLLKAKQAAVEVQARETLEHARELAGRAMKSAPGKALNRENADASLSEKGALSPSEEALLRQMIQENGNVAGQKKPPQMTGYVNGEPLNRPEGSRAVKSMTAQEGEVLKILSGGEGPQVRSRAKAARPASPQQNLIPRDDAFEGSGKTPASDLLADKARQEFAGLSESTQGRLAQAGPVKKQGVAGWTSTETPDVHIGTGAVSGPQGRGVDNPALVRPQAVISQILDGVSQILRDGSGRMVLTLQPPRLGTLDLDVVVQDNRVKMVMLADNQEVKQLLQAGMDDLRNALQDKGFEIDRLEVLVQDRPDEAGSDFWQGAGFTRSDSRKEVERKPGQDAEPVAQETPMRAIRKGDSALSVFA